MGHSFRPAKYCDNCFREYHPRNPSSELCPECRDLDRRDHASAELINLRAMREALGMKPLSDDDIASFKASSVDWQYKPHHPAIPTI